MQETPVLSPALSQEQQQQWQELQALQLQYMLTLQAMQQKQMMGDMVMDIMRGNGERITCAIETQSKINACSIAGNCEVIFVPEFK